MQMDKEKLKRLLAGRQDGSNSPSEKEELDRWFSGLADKKDDLSQQEKEEIKNRMLVNILAATEKSDGKVMAGKNVYLTRFLKVAASVSLIIASVLIFREFNVSDIVISHLPEAEISNTVIITNDTQKVKVVRLPDGSSVQLKSKSSITYAKEFSNEKREVSLVGEAFFDVTKDPEKPFFVYSGNLVTRVLGTSFTLIAPPNASTIEVNVVSGRVSVYESENSKIDKNEVTKGVILTRNQKATYFVKENHLITSLVEQPSPEETPTRQNKLLVFDDTTLGEIALRLEENYSIEFVMENASIGNCTFTGDLSEMTLFDVLSVICRSLELKYQVMGTKILFDGEGCQKNVIE